MGKSDRPNLLCAGFFKHAGGLFEGSARGFHIVNNDELFDR